MQWGGYLGCFVFTSYRFLILTVVNIPIITIIILNDNSVFVSRKQAPLWCSWILVCEVRLSCLTRSLTLTNCLRGLTVGFLATVEVYILLGDCQLGFFSPWYVMNWYCGITDRQLGFRQFRLESLSLSTITLFTSGFCHIM